MLLTFSILTTFPHCFPNTTMILYLTKDLMLASNVRSVATSENIELKIVPSLEKLLEQLDAGEGDSNDVEKVLVDLQTPGLAPEKYLEMVAQCQLSSVPIVGYAQHVFVELIDAAKSAGFSAVYTRGQMSGNVAAILKQ